MDFAALVGKAEVAGRIAALQAVPVPMVVGTAKGLSDEIDYTKPIYIDDEGPCGFAWIEFAGNTPFGRWMKAHNKARKGYPKGLVVWVSEFGQSITRKEAYAQAYAKVLQEAGIDAWANSRLD